MLYAWVGDQKRAPISKGERTTCRDCGGLLTAVMPVENTPHWRHKAGDCLAEFNSVEAVGLDKTAFASHSLRSGFLTTGAAEAGASVFKLMEISRQRSVDTLTGYVSRADAFKDHAGAALL